MIHGMADERFKDSYMGEWQLAGSSQPPVGGVLTIGEQIQLRTPRGLRDRPAGRRIQHDRFTNEVIIGDVPGPDSKVTLLGCRSGASRTTPNGIGDVETFASAMLIGDRHLSKESERKFDQLSFRLTGLNSWMGRRPFTDDSDADSGSVYFTRPPDVTFPVPDGQAVIGRSYSATHGDTIGSIRSEEEIQIQLDRPQSFNALYVRYIRPLRFFFDLATDEPCRDSHVIMANSKVWASYGLPAPFQVRYGDAAEPEYTRSIRQEMVFTLDDIEPATHLPLWFELEARLNPVCDLLFSLREQSMRFIPTRAFTAASAAEGMHSRLSERKDTAEHQARLDRIYQAVGEGPDQQWLRNKLMHSDVTYAGMLGNLINEAGVAFAPYLGLQVKRWTRRINDYRNIVAHTLPGMAKRPEEVLRLASTVELLLRIILLRRLGFAEEQCLKMISRTWRWPRFRAALPAEVPYVCLPSGSDHQPSPAGRKGL